MVQQDPPQLPRRHGIKVRTILPLNRLGLKKPKICFVQNGCGLQRMLTVLAAHLAGRDPMQIAIDQFHQLARRFRIA